MKKIISLFSFVLIAISMSAQTSVTVDGIKYNLDGSSATVTYPNEARPDDGDNRSSYTGDIVIPPTITVGETTYNVTTLGERAFYRAKINSISLPEGLLTIGKKSLMGSKIAELTVPNSVTKLGDEAAESCSNLKKITLGEHNADNKWGAWVFWRSSGGYDVYMVCDIKPNLYDNQTFDDTHESIIHVRAGAFDDFKADSKWNIYNIVADMSGGLTLKSFTIDGVKYKMTAEDKVNVVYPTDGKPGSSNPNTYTGDISIPAQVTYDNVTYSVTGIGDYAFRYSGITSISLPEGLVSIGKEAIYNTKITEITLPNSVTKLDESCISENSKLKTITVGKNAAQEKWGSWIFWRASGGYDVYMVCDAMPKLADNQTFDDSHESNIHVYPSQYLTYKSNYYWANHNIVADLQEEITNEQLQEYIATYGAKLPTDEEIGTDPGYYTAASVKALKDALEFATSLGEDATLEQRNKAYYQLIVAADGLQINPLNEGYYYIEGLYNNKYMRSSSDNYVAVKTFDESDARFCFKLTHKGSNWYIQSADESKMYVGAPDGDGWVTATSTPDYEQIITLISGGKFKIQCLSEGTESALYGQTSGYVFVKDYTEDNNRAQWRFHPVQSGKFEQEFNIENIRVREYMAEVTYTKEDKSKMEKYNIAPPARRDTPEPATIFWTRNEDATAQYITWSTNADFADATSVEVNNSNTFYEIYNLIPGKTYYYKVTATVDGNDTELVNSSFTTNGQLRQIKADGGGNIRDLGGWATASGKPIKYGLIYRGAELNGKYNLTQDGIDALRAVGIKAELDLRSSNEALYIDKSPLGDDVTYIRIHNENYYEGGVQSRQDLYKKDFEFVFDCLKKDKPVFFHCHIGADRTGTLAFLIEGLLGVSESDMYKEYELTSFSYFDTERPKDYIDGLLDYINTLDGETLTDKFYTYCHKELGLSAKDIADFRMKMLGVIYPADIDNMVTEALNSKATSVDLSNYVFEAKDLAGSMPDGSNLLVTVSPESGINGTNIINNAVCESLVLTDGSDFGAPYAFTATKASYITQVNNYATLILPFEAAVPAEFTASKAVSVEGTTVNLESVATISANKPVLVEGNGQLVLTATDIAVPATPSRLSTGLLRGVYKSTAAEEGSYVLQNQNNVIGFYCVADVKPTINAFRAYMDVPASNVKAYFFNEDATGVKNIDQSTLNMEHSAGVVYDLSGRKVNSQLKKGVYISGNKKVLY